MIPIIDPVDRTLILKELTADKLLRKTNNGGNEIYVVTARNSPNIMQELGRLRELSFRDAGGGTGAAVDIDAEDTAEEGYQQLFVWDPKAQEIVGGYRFIVSRTPHPKHMSATNSATNSCPTPSNWAVRSYSRSTRGSAKIPKGSTRSTTCGTASAHWSSPTPT